MIEVWKDIFGYEGLYKVSNLGNVKSLGNDKKRKEKILKSYRNKCDGYLFVVLCKEGKRKNIYIHRLVVQAFLTNPDKLPQVNHKDENKLNNNVSNLEFCTSKYNNNYGTHNERSAKTKKNGKLSKKVKCIDTNVVYPSIREIERQLGFDRSDISRCCKGKLNTCGGFHWEYV